MMDEGEDESAFLGALSSFMPLISDMLGEGIRRVTVRVKWEQGSSEKEFVLSQFIVHPSQGSQDLFNAALLLGEAPEDDELDPNASGSDESSKSVTPGQPGGGAMTPRARSF